MDSEQDTDKSMDITSSQVSSGHEDSFSQLYILVESPSESKSTNNTNNESTVIDSRCQEIADVEETGTNTPKSEGYTPKQKISRELKGLHKAAAQSKIITEFTNVKEKKRSRKPLNSPSITKDQDNDKKSADILSDIDKTHVDDVTPKSNKSRSVRTLADNRKPIKLECFMNSKESEADMFCWQCHKIEVNISCKTCPRSFHQRCVKSATVIEETDWCCPECITITQAEKSDSRLNILKQLSIKHLCDLLKFALIRMTDYAGAEPFLSPVDKNDFPDYAKYVVHPMDLSKLGQNISKRKYTCTEAFIADTKWILHNSIIYNSVHTKLTSAAKGIIKICKQEVNEIETCPECYLKANTNNDTSWFLEVCSHPHMLVWAKLKGYPYWPAKAMTVSSGGLVDVRFFGAHDRAWIPMKDCLLFSERDPNFSDKGKRADFVESLKELALYVKNLEKKFGKFHHAPFKTPYPQNQELIYSTMLPSYDYKSNSIEHKLIKETKEINVINKLETNSENIIKTSSIDEDGSNEGYGTEDEEPLKEVSDSENTSKTKQTPLRASVRMRGGKINSSGKIKIIKIMKESKEEQLSDSLNSSSQSDLSQTINNDSNNEINMDISYSFTNKRKLSKSISETKDKKVKHDDSYNAITSSKDDCKGSDITSSGTSHDDQSFDKSNNSLDKEINPNEKVHDAIKTFTIIDKFPQISISGPSQLRLVNKINSHVECNSNDMKTTSSTRVILKRKEPSAGKCNSTKKNFISKINLPINEINKKLIKHNNEPKSHIQSNNEDTKIPSPSNAVVKPDSTITLCNTEIKTEPPDDYETPNTNDSSESLSEVYNNDATNSLSNLKKQSARKSFPNKPKINTTAVVKKTLKELVTTPLNMVFIPHSTSSTQNFEAKLQKSITNLRHHQQTPDVEMTPKRFEAVIRTSTPSTNSVVPGQSISSNNIEIMEKQDSKQSQLSTEARYQNRSGISPSTIPLRAPLPSECGPVTKLINDNVFKLSSYFQRLIYETLVDFGSAGSTEAQLRKMQADIEGMKWMHKQKLYEIKHNTEIMLLEMRNSFETENTQKLTRFRKKAEADRIRSVQEAKTKQWCVYCGKEAQFYCCWNTSYCDHECQKKHWQTHMTVCGQHREASQDDIPSSKMNDSRNIVKSKMINHNTNSRFKGTPKLKLNLNNSTISNRNNLINVRTGQFEVLNHSQSPVPSINKNKNT